MNSQKERKKLGRGLSALIPDVESIDDKGIVEVDVALIDPNPKQPRKAFDPEALDELRLSIEEVGVLSPIMVQKVHNRYQLISGERRLQAAKLAGKSTIPCIFRDVDSEELLKIALIENIQREDLNEIELADAYMQLRKEFYFTHSDIAKKVGKSRSVVANTLRLLELSQNLQEAVRSGEITSGHARALLSLDEEKREKVLEIIRKKSLSVREVEELTQGQIGSTNGNGTTKKVGKKSELDMSDVLNLDPDTMSLLKKTEELLRTRIQVHPSKKSPEKGKVVINYYGEEDLKHIIARLAGLKYK